MRSVSSFSSSPNLVVLFAAFDQSSHLDALMVVDLIFVLIRRRLERLDVSIGPVLRLSHLLQFYVADCLAAASWRGLCVA